MIMYKHKFEYTSRAHLIADVVCTVIVTIFGICAFALTLYNHLY